MKFEDLVGQKFGQYKVLEFSHTNRGRGAVFKCKCKCGQITALKASELRSGRITQCRSCSLKSFHTSRTENDIGQTYNNLTISEIISINREFIAKCKCVCGNSVEKPLRRIKEGLYISCGCIPKSRKKKKPYSKPLIDPRFNVYRHCSTSKKRGFFLTREQFYSIISSPCTYCGLVDKIGIDRIDSSVGYQLGNVVPSCFQCNLSKSDYSIDEFIEWRNRLFLHNISKDEIIKNAASINIDNLQLDE